MMSSGDVCPKCEEPFDTDVSLMSSADKHRLPFTCSKCFFFTICGSCFDDIDWRTFECPVCNKKQGFDRDDLVPNRLLCSILAKQQQGQDQAQARNHVVSPPASESDNGNGISDAQPDGSVPSSAAPKRLSGVARKSESVKTESSTPVRRPPGAKKPPIRKKKKTANVADSKVGDRVYCLWPDTKEWYWGHVVEAHEEDNGDPIYKVRCMPFCPLGRCR